VRWGGWQTSIGRELGRRTLGVLTWQYRCAGCAHRPGLRHEGRRLDPEYDREIAEGAGATLVAREELFRQADVVTIHLVLSARTLGSSGERSSRS
jgi:hypothetical protein